MNEAIVNSKGFSISGLAEVLASGSMNYTFKTPKITSGKIVRLKVNDIQTSASKVRVDLYEVPNAPVAGSDVTAYNHYRVGTPVSSAMQTIKFNATLNMTDAIMLNYQYVANRPLDFEWVLNPDTWYVCIVTNLTGETIDASFYTFWIEE